MGNVPFVNKHSQTEVPPGLKQRIDRNQINEIAFSPDCKRLAAGSGEHIRIYNLETGVQFAMLSGHAERIRALTFGYDNVTLASASDDNTLRLWDTDAAREISVVTGDAHFINALASAPDGIPLTEWAEGTQTLFPSVTEASRVSALAFNPEGTIIASASITGKVQVLELETGKLNDAFTAHDGLVLAATFTASRAAPDNCRLVTAGSDTFIRVWELESKNLLCTFKGHTGSVHALAVSPGGMTVSAGKDRTVRWWETETGRLLATQDAPDIWKLAFSPDGEQLIAIHQNGTFSCSASNL